MTMMMPLTDEDALFDLELRVVLPNGKDENSLDSRTRFSDTTVSSITVSIGIDSRTQLSDPTVSSVTVSSGIICLATEGRTAPSMYNT